MESRNKTPNSVYGKHLKVKAWSEYTIDYFGLTLEKKQMFTITVLTYLKKYFKIFRLYRTFKIKNVSTNHI